MPAKVVHSRGFIAILVIQKACSFVCLPMSAAFLFSFIIEKRGLKCDPL